MPKSTISSRTHAYLAAGGNERAGKAHAGSPGHVAHPVVVSRLHIAAELALLLPPLLLPAKPPYQHTVVAAASGKALFIVRVRVRARVCVLRHESTYASNCSWLIGNSGRGFLLETAGGDSLDPFMSMRMGRRVRTRWVWESKTYKRDKRAQNKASRSKEHKSSRHTDTSARVPQFATKRTGEAFSTNGAQLTALQPSRWAGSSLMYATCHESSATTHQDQCEHECEEGGETARL